MFVQLSYTRDGYALKGEPDGNGIVGKDASLTPSNNGDFMGDIMGISWANTWEYEFVPNEKSFSTSRGGSHLR